MTDSIFDDQNSTPPVADTPPAPAPSSLPAGLEGLVGEGKKYATVEAALSSLPHKEQHIARLEQEMAELRSKVGQSDAAQEAYAAMQDLLKEMKATPAALTLDDASIDARIVKQMEEREAQRIAASNGSTVQKALIEKFGDKAAEVYKAKAEELGIGEKFLSDLARKSPKAVLAYFGMHGDIKQVAPSSGSIVSERFTQQQPAKRQSVMAGASTKEVVAAWRAAKPQD